MGTRRWLAGLAAAALALPLVLQGCGGSSSGGGGPAADTAPPTVTAAPPGGAFDAPLSVTLSASDDVDPSPAIYYTLDGSEPTTASIPYTGPVDLSASTTLNFFAVDASGNASAVVAEEYVIVGTVASEDFEAVASRLNAVLKLGYNTVTPDAAFKLFFDGNPANDPFLLDTRDAADFARGHIPGAVNIPLKELPGRMLDGTAGIPADRNVVVASYYGGDGNMASLLINAVRIADAAAPHPRSQAVMMGMMGWSYDAALSNGHRFDDDLGTKRISRPTETEAHAAADHGYPIWSAGAGTLEERILRRAEAYLSRFANQLDLQVNGVELAALLDDDDPANDPAVLSVRGGADYLKGHVPGAVNIPWQQVAEVAKAKAVDPAKPTVVYCYTGHTGSLATMALGILGYDVTNLLYGMNGWNTSSAVASGQLVGFDAGVRAWDFPVNDGGAGDIGSLAAYSPPASCEGCHTSHAAIFYDRTVTPPAGAVAPPSAGEG